MRIVTQWRCLVSVLGCGIAFSAPAALPHFPAGAVWQRNISSAPLAGDSSAIINHLDADGGWGNNDRLQIDFSLTVLHANPDTPILPVAEGAVGYYTPDCEPIGLAFPLPPGGAIEGSPNYSCDPEDEDCHLLVQQDDRLYESYGTNVTANEVQSTCAVLWRLDRVYPRQGRGDQCTSTDAAGFPVAPLLIDADEVAAAVNSRGDLGHALRFILPNIRMAKKVYVRPASHAGGPSGPSDRIPYGSRLRLRADFPLTGYNAAAKVILRTMQRYGLVLADGGSIALTASNDDYTTAKWATLGIGSHTFSATSGATKVSVTDFDVIQTGPRIPLTYDCVRTPDDFVFIDGFGY